MLGPEDQGHDVQVQPLHLMKPRYDERTAPDDQGGGLVHEPRNDDGLAGPGFDNFNPTHFDRRS